MPFNSISIDIETTGLCPTENEILEIGLVCYNTGEEVKDIPSENLLRLVFVKENYNVSPEVLKMHSKLFEEILEAKKQLQKNRQNILKRDFTSYLYVESVDHIAVETLIEIFLDKNGYGTEDKVIVTGKNFASFDLRFMERIPFLERLIARFSHKFLDPGSLFLTLEDTEVPGLYDCMQRSSIDSDVDHTSIQDAIDTLNCVKNKLN